MPHAYGCFEHDTQQWHFARCEESGIVTRANQDPNRVRADADAIDREFKLASMKGAPSKDWRPSTSETADEIYSTDIPEQCRVWIVWENGKLTRYAAVGPKGALHREVFDHEDDAIAKSRELAGLTGYGMR